MSRRARILRAYDAPGPLAIVARSDAPSLWWIVDRRTKRRACPRPFPSVAAAYRAAWSMTTERPPPRPRQNPPRAP